MDEVLENQLKKFFVKSPPMKYKKRETIIRSDDDPTGVFYLEAGYIKMNSISESGTELTLNIFKPGSFFPMVWAIGNIKNTYFYQAITDVVVYRAMKKEVVEFIQKNPEILFDLTQRILIGLDGLLANVQHLLFGSAYNRVASAILLCAKRFGIPQANGKINVSLPLTHQDIANLAGLARETTSISIEQLEKKGILAQDKRLFVINDLKKLQAESFTSPREEITPPAF